MAVLGEVWLAPRGVVFCMAPGFQYKVNRALAHPQRSALSTGCPGAFAYSAVIPFPSYFPASQAKDQEESASIAALTLCAASPFLKSRPGGRQVVQLPLYSLFRKIRPTQPHRLRNLLSVYHQRPSPHSSVASYSRSPMILV